MNQALATLQSLTAAEHDAGMVFSGKPSGRLVRGYASPCEFTPYLNHNYVFHEHSRDMVVWFLGDTDPLYIYGPMGCGKSSLVRQLSSRLNYPVFEVTGHSRLEFPDLAGHLTVRNGSMEFEYGPLALAMRYGAVFLLNEIDLLEPSTAAGLNGILDGQPLCIPENNGELITPHPMFRFVATANTNGGSDETGLYQGALRQNIAFMDRFILCYVDYPHHKDEEELLAKSYPTLPRDIIDKMVNYAGEVRRLFMGDVHNYNSNTIEVTFSTRTLLRWADLTLRYQPLAKQGVKPVSYALDRALGFRATLETRAMLHELVQRVFSFKEQKSSSVGEQ
jgi:AAA ATPase containing von Willebrand factor type A (vWA) domain